MKLKSIDVPQADSLVLVRRLVGALKLSQSSAAKDLAQLTGFSERHVRYRLATARVLGFVSMVDKKILVTPRGLRLLSTDPGSPAEKIELRRAVGTCQAIQEIAPDLLSTASVDIKSLARKIARVSGLSPSTAERRAVVLRMAPRFGIAGLQMAKRRPKKLRPNVERFFNFISTKNEGDTVTDQGLLAAAGWESATLRTHRDKNAFSPFLTTLGPGRYRVRRDGVLISRSDVTDAFTQIRPAEFVLSAGTRVKAAADDYELVGELGRGAVAHVWRAKSVRNEKPDALKVMNPRADLLNPSTLENVKHRFSREARNGPKLAHDNIVAYVDVGDHQSHPFLVMELADESLASMIAVNPPEEPRIGADSLSAQLAWRLPRIGTRITRPFGCERLKRERLGCRRAPTGPGQM